MLILPLSVFCDQRFTLLPHATGDSLLMCASSVWKQLTAEWAWASATICALQSWHRSTRREVRQYYTRVRKLLGGLILGSCGKKGALNRKLPEKENHRTFGQMPKISDVEC